jgi:hypothetical protein
MKIEQLPEQLGGKLSIAGPYDLDDGRLQAPELRREFPRLLRRDEGLGARELCQPLANLMAGLGGPRFGGERHVQGLLELAVAPRLLNQDLCQSLGAELRQALDGELRSCRHPAQLPDFAEPTLPATFPICLCGTDVFHRPAPTGDGRSDPIASVSA